MKHLKRHQLHANNADIRFIYGANYDMPKSGSGKGINFEIPGRSKKGGLTRALIVGAGAVTLVGGATVVIKSLNTDDTIEVGNKEAEAKNAVSEKKYTVEQLKESIALSISLIDISASHMERGTLIRESNADSYPEDVAKVNETLSLLKEAGVFETNINIGTRFDQELIKNFQESNFFKTVHATNFSEKDIDGIVGEKFWIALQAGLSQVKNGEISIPAPTTTEISNNDRDEASITTENIDEKCGHDIQDQLTSGIRDTYGTAAVASFCDMALKLVDPSHDMEMILVTGQVNPRNGLLEPEINVAKDIEKADMQRAVRTKVQNSDAPAFIAKMNDQGQFVLIKAEAGDDGKVSQEIQFRS